MDIAILPGDYLSWSDFKLCLWLISWLEKLPTTPAVGDYLYPLYVVLSLHGVGNIANLDFYVSICGFNNGHMLFQSNIRCFLLEQLHWLSATDQFPFSGM